MTGSTVSAQPASPSAPSNARGWTKPIAVLAIAALVLLAIFARDAIDMVAIWWNASTFNHCMLVPLISGWLVAQRREEVARLSPRVWLPGLALTGAGALLWYLGAIAGIALFRHAALVLMLQSLVPVILGPVVTRGLLFPLFYLVFMVPAGEELVPVLQTVTAKMSMGLLGLFGVPAHIDGVFITIPNGYFEVAEACSGVKFLVAMVAFGALVANVCFKSWPRRIAFMALAIAVPILANGLRAFGTIYFAHLTSADTAVGFDHVVYGWFFFAFVMAAVMAIGWKFFDRKVGDPWIDDVVDTPVGQGNAPWIGAVAAIAVAAVAPAGNAALAAAGRQAMPHAIALPDVPGWTRVAASGVAWEPNYAGADHRLLGHYGDGNGAAVDLAIILYAWQDEGREIAGFGQGAANGDKSGWTWTAERPAPQDGKAERILAAGPVSREVVSFYRVNGITTGDAGRVKLETLKGRLPGGKQAAAVIMVSAVDREGAPARAAIDRFLAGLGEPGVLADRTIATAQGR